MNPNTNTPAEPDTTPDLTAARREIKARYLTAGMAVICAGFGDPLTVSVVHRYADDTILVQFDEVDGELPYHPEEGVTVVGAPEHYHAAGSTGGPGACSAVCACGTAVAGFDTVAEAAAVLDQHIANPDGTSEPTTRQRLAAELRHLVDGIVRLDLPVGGHIRMHLGVLDSRADLEKLSGYLGSEITEDGGTGGDIPFTEHTIRLDDDPWGPELHIRAQIQPDGRSEVERLRARVAELESQQGGTR
ncbi:hypothetical protein [Micromonospora inyonensis]|uniref:DUF2470 domain-containing protein n=1 Tax=Micromonospora inyonensis TaxID=47866 RepID=A0A1C6R749_9ACTN|nr:hypothetical protein [Micromonospora inyonensis]SCL12829.1 hypothetical protein GA0074694_0018 [Micromonospora inyonensis]SCL21594.1 hypothetical protein GA0074694_3081 [Micromonospora inyonensis]